MNIIEKITVTDTGFLYEPVYYTESQTMVDNVNGTYYTPYMTWYNENLEQIISGDVSINDYFSIQPLVYCANKTQNSLDGSELQELIDINTLDI